MDVTFLESEMFFIPRDTHSSLQGETKTEDQNWMSENWINWDSEEQRDPEGQQDSDQQKISEQEDSEPEQGNSNKMRDPK